jgi:hypothetical protein
MRTRWALLLAAVPLVWNPAALPAEEVPAKSRIVSVGLFKNGLAVVRRELTVNGPGTFRLDDAPDPVHGTFWVESNSPVETLVKMREVEVPEGVAGNLNLQEDLAGKKVTVHFMNGNIPAVSGEVLPLERPKVEDPSVRVARRNAWGGETPEQPARFLVLKTAKGRGYIEASQIGYLEVEGQTDKPKRRQPVLLLTVGKTDKEPGPIFVSYLARGMAWAPSYRVDISDPKTLVLEQSAVVKNELTALKDTELQLISGFPSVQFANVTSPLSARTSWEAFFQQLRQRWGGDSPFLGNAVVAQQALLNNPVAPGGLDLSATPAGEGVDLHYQSLGKRTLDVGESLSLNVAKGKAAYERIVEWLVPDTRNEHGVYAGRRGEEGDEESDGAWDALRFKNPLPFPMTTGPAMVVANDRFNGQRASFWVNAGEEMTLHVNKALSIRTRSTEQEEVKKDGTDQRDVLYVGGRPYRKVTVAGELLVSNHRKEEVKVVLRRRFSGDLLHADGDPKASLREEGVYSINKRNELLWTFKLPAGEEKKLTYRYWVLVGH